MSYYIKSEDHSMKCVKIWENGQDGQDGSFAVIYGETMKSAKAVAESVIAELNMSTMDTERLRRDENLDTLMRAATIIYCEVDGSTPESAAMDAMTMFRRIVE